MLIIKETVVPEEKSVSEDLEYSLDIIKIKKKLMKLSIKTDGYIPEM